jgi:hypothetical protein
MKADLCMVKMTGNAGDKNEESPQVLICHVFALCQTPSLARVNATNNRLFDAFPTSKIMAQRNRRA